MKPSTKRSIPPPLDISASGSNFMWEATNRHGLAGELFVGDHSPTSGWRHAMYLDKEAPPFPLSAPPRRVATFKSTQSAWTPALPATDERVPSSSDGSYLLMSEMDGSKLVPNRRRSYSESNSSSFQRSEHGVPSAKTPLTAASFNDTSSGAMPSLKPSLSFSLGFKRSKTLKVKDRCVSGEEKKTKLWSSIIHPSPSASVKHDSGKSTDSVNITLSPRKLRRPGTSPSPSSYYTSFIDTGGPSNAVGGKGKMEGPGKLQRPSTASSAGSRSFSLRVSKKLDSQWKRLSSLRSASSSISSFSTHPSAPSLSPSSSLTSMSTSSQSSPISPMPTTPRETDDNTLLNGQPPAQCGLRQHNAKLMMLTNSRTTPNLQAPNLNIEDLGKVNAFYAPPPPAHSIQALNDAKLKSTHSLPLETTKVAPKLGILPIQSSVNVQNTKVQKIPIELPLPPRASIGDRERECNILYFTVEDTYDEESGQVTHQLVEICM